MKKVESVLRKNHIEYSLANDETPMSDIEWKEALNDTAIWSVLNAMKEYARQVAEQVRQDCAKNAKMVYHCGHTKINTPSVHHQVGADNIKIDKQSILSTEIKLP